MNKVRLDVPDEALDGYLTVISRDDAGDKADPLWQRHRINLMVAAQVGADSVPMLLQQLAFLRNYNILAPRLLVGIVNNENLHASE
jgi:hypothetical protein